MNTSTDKFLKVAPNTGWQVGGGGVSDASATTIPMVNADNLPDDTPVIVTIDRVDANDSKTPHLMERIVGEVSGTNLINCIRGVEGTAQPHAAGAVVEVVIATEYWNKLIAGILKEHNADGSHSKANDWIADTFTYASAKTITVADGSKYSKGDKIKFVQSTDGQKYMYVIGVSGNTLTVTGGSDYDLDNEEITAAYYSKVSTPVGFPQYFNYIPSWSGLSLGDGSVYATFSIIGNTVHCDVRLDSFGASTSISGSVSFSLPVPCTIYSPFTPLGNAYFHDNGTTVFVGMVLFSSSTYATIYANDSNSTYTRRAELSPSIPMVWTTGDDILTSFTFRLA